MNVCNPANLFVSLKSKTLQSYYRAIPISSWIVIFELNFLMCLWKFPLEISNSQIWHLQLVNFVGKINMIQIEKNIKFENLFRRNPRGEEIERVVKWNRISRAAVL